MRVFKLVCISMAVMAFITHAEKSTYSIFSIGPAIPLGSTAATVLPTSDSVQHTKNLSTGWGASWTFLGFPFLNSPSPILSGLAFGGKVSYNRWVRDSTWTEVSFLGTQAIVRYDLPPVIKPFKLFAQAGFGMFIGLNGFTNIDTLEMSAMQNSQAIVTNGVKHAGASFNMGIDWDVIEVTPGITVVFTNSKTSAWFSIDAAMKL